MFNAMRLPFSSSRKPKREDIRALMDQFDRDQQFLTDNREDLLRKYADEFVAVYHERIVAHSKNEASLLTKLAKQRIPADWTAIQLVSTRRRILLL